MKIDEAMSYARIGIRRRCWVAGLRIRWNDDFLRWEYTNIFSLTRKLPVDESQGCLTPETMVADDWEAWEERP